MPNIIRLALQLPNIVSCPIPLLKHNQNKSITLSQQQIACLLANAFLCTFPRRNEAKHSSEYAYYPSINFSSLFQTDSDSSFEKLRCICNYFRRVLRKSKSDFANHVETCRAKSNISSRNKLNIFVVVLSFSFGFHLCVSQCQLVW